MAKDKGKQEPAHHNFLYLTVSPRLNTRWAVTHAQQAILCVQRNLLTRLY
jgi:hypothetical protein